MSKKNAALTIPNFPDCVDILGKNWRIKIVKKGEDLEFDKEHCEGLCSFHERLIRIIDTHCIERYENAPQMLHGNYMKEVLRHEIIHAFLNESGLCCNSSRFPGPWSKNEEMVDWFAIQGPKISEAWKKCGCLKDTEEETEK